MRESVASYLYNAIAKKMQVILPGTFDCVQNATKNSCFRSKNSHFGQKRQNRIAKFVTNPDAANLDIFANICYNTV